MVKYYRIDRQLVQDCTTEIPKNMWERKQLVPYEEVIIKIQDTETKPENKLELFKDKAVGTIYEIYHVETLQEAKEDKIQQLKMKCTETILGKYPEYKQINAALGIYTEEEIVLIKTFISESRDKVNNLIEQVNLCITIDEVQKIIWQ